MNEFLELKPSESVADVLEYNGESVLLLDHSNRRNFHTGERLRMDLMASLYRRSVLREGTVRWRLIGDDGTIHRRGGWSVRDVANGTVQRLGTVDWTMPELSQPARWPSLFNSRGTSMTSLITGIFGCSRLPGPR
jgi:hypothetical protein